MYPTLRPDWQEPLDSLPTDLFLYEKIEEWLSGFPGLAIVGAQGVPVSCPLAWYLRSRTGRPWRPMAEMVYTIPPGHVVKTGAEMELYSLQMPQWVRHLVWLFDTCATDDRGYILAEEARRQLLKVSPVVFSR